MIDDARPGEADVSEGCSHSVPLQRANLSFVAIRSGRFAPSNPVKRSSHRLRRADVWSEVTTMIGRVIRRSALQPAERLRWLRS